MQRPSPHSHARCAPQPRGWSQTLAFAGVGGAGAAAAGVGAWFGARGGSGRARALPAAGEHRALALRRGGRPLACVLSAEPCAPVRCGSMLPQKERWALKQETSGY